MHPISFHRFQNDQALAEYAATRWLDLLAARNNAGAFSVALSGGRIARHFFAATARSAHARGALPDGIEVFWTDERCVPPDHPDSNYLLARQCLIEPLWIPDRSLHRIRGERDPEEAAQASSDELRKFVPCGPSGIPRIDLVILGMGEDGHVASIFPNASATTGPAFFRAVTSPKPPSRRVTMTHELICAAAMVWVLISGPGKDQAFAASLDSAGNTPLARVLQSGVPVVIFTDLPEARRQDLP